MTSKVGALSNYFPEELKSAVKGFDDEIRQAIMAYLLLDGDRSFTELAKGLRVSKPRLAHHLDILLNASLLRNYSPKEYRGRFDSYYGMSSFGNAFVSSLAETFSIPTSPMSGSTSAGNSAASLNSQSSIPTPLARVSQPQVTSALGPPATQLASP